MIMRTQTDSDIEAISEVPQKQVILPDAPQASVTFSRQKGLLPQTRPPEYG